MWNRYDFPVFLLSEESTQTLRKVIFLLLSYTLFIFRVLFVQSLVPCLYIDDHCQLKVAEKNEKADNGYRANVAEFDLVMQVWICFFFV